MKAKKKQNKRRLKWRRESKEKTKEKTVTVTPCQTFTTKKTRKKKTNKAVTVLNVEKELKQTKQKNKQNEKTVKVTVQRLKTKQTKSKLKWQLLRHCEFVVFSFFFVDVTVAVANCTGGFFSHAIWIWEFFYFCVRYSRKLYGILNLDVFLKDCEFSIFFCFCLR